jgi:hypothetical protein
MNEVQTENKPEVVEAEVIQPEVVDAEVVEVPTEAQPEAPAEGEKLSNEDMFKRIKQQNPGVKIIKNKDGGFQISNPRAPSKLLTNLLKRASK